MVIKMEKRELKRTLSNLSWENRFGKLFESMPQQDSSDIYADEKLDRDVDAFHNETGICNGTILDIGTGWGVQAAVLAKRGFELTATDISPSAINFAKKMALMQGVNVNFIIDDILSSQIDQRFDLVLDRGCFTCLHKNFVNDYIKKIESVTHDNSWFLLKADNRMPRREKIDIFMECHNFQVVRRKKTSYTFYEIYPAMFFAMKKKV